MTFDVFIQKKNLNQLSFIATGSEKAAEAKKRPNKFQYIGTINLEVTKP
jgi:hypothetical protein